MKTLKFFAIAVAMLFATGCATGGFDANNTQAAQAGQKKGSFTEKNRSTIADAEVGGMLGAGTAILLGKNPGKWLLGGALLGGAAGAAEDHRRAEDERIAQEIRKDSPSDNHSANAVTYETKANKERAMQVREECRRARAELAGTKSANRVPECHSLSDYALDNMTDEQVSQLVFQADTGGKGMYPYTSSRAVYNNGIRRGSPHEYMWYQRRAMGDREQYYSWRYGRHYQW